MSDNKAEVPQPTQRSVISRRTAIEVIGGTVAGIVAETVLPKVAEAQLIPSPEPQIPEDIKMLAEKKTQIAKKFIYHLPGQEAQDITIQYSNGPETTVSVTYGMKDLDLNEKTIQNARLQITHSSQKPYFVASMARRIDEGMGMLVRESNPKKDLGRSLAQAFEKHLGISLDQIAAGRTTPEQMAKLEEISNIFGFYPGGNIFVHRERSQLADQLFDSSYSIWLNESEKLSQELAKLSPEAKVGMSNVFLEDLELIMDCAQPGVSLNDVGINRNVVDFIIAMSENPRHKQFFDKIAA